jgi:hypothetical protein
VSSGDVQAGSQQMCRASEDWLSCAYKSEVFGPMQDKSFVLHFGCHVLRKVGLAVKRCSPGY